MTQAAARDKLDEAKGDQREHLPIPSDRLTVGDFLKQWLDEHVKPNRAELTFESYSDLVRLHIKPALGRIVLSKLSPLDVQRLINAKIAEREIVNGEPKKKFSPRRIEVIHAVLRSALNCAVKWQLVKRNVANGAALPRVQRHKMQPLDETQAVAFLDAIRGNRLEALYTIVVPLGPRLGEILGLRWEDLELEKGGTVRFEQAVKAIGGKLVLRPLKSVESHRDLILPSFAVSALRAHRKQQLKERLFAGKRWKEHGLVFTTSIGTPIHPRNLRRDFKAVLVNAQLPMIRFHDLRHTAGTLLALQGVHERTIMHVLGHTQISTTIGYTHVADAMKQDAATRMQTLLGTGRG